MKNVVGNDIDNKTGNDVNNDVNNDINNDLKELAATAALYLRRLSNAVAALADRARLSPPAGIGGGAEMEEIVAGLEWSMSAMRILSAQNGGNSASDCAHIVSCLKMALDSLQNGDCVFFADMLEFEVNPVIMRWQIWSASLCKT